MKKQIGISNVFTVKVVTDDLYREVKVFVGGKATIWLLNQKSQGILAWYQSQSIFGLSQAKEYYTNRGLIKK